MTQLTVKCPATLLAAADLPDEQICQGRFSSGFGGGGAETVRTQGSNLTGRPGTTQNLQSADGTAVSCGWWDPSFVLAALPLKLLEMMDAVAELSDGLSPAAAAHRNPRTPLGVTKRFLEVKFSIRGLSLLNLRLPLTDADAAPPSTERRKQT